MPQVISFHMGDPGTTKLRLENTNPRKPTSGPPINATFYVMGSDPDSGNPCFLVNDPNYNKYSMYIASSADVPQNYTKIPCEIAFTLPPWSCVELVLPYVESGRIYVVYNNKLDFSLNPGTGSPSICQPSGTSETSDINADYNKMWAYCEYTFTAVQLYANISFVDFVSLPIAMALTGASGGIGQVLGVPPWALPYIAKYLQDQDAASGTNCWSQLIRKDPNGGILRVVAPTYCNAFNNYLEDYISDVWNYYTTNTLTIQSSSGTFQGKSDGTNMTFTGIGAVPKPSSSDVWHSTGGIFDTPVGNIMGAGLNRGSLIPLPEKELGEEKIPQINQPNQQPNGPYTKDFYKHCVTNHYARVVHGMSLDTKGYCHPYDDVTGTNCPDQSGCVLNTKPSTWVVTVGGPLVGQGAEYTLPPDYGKTRRKQRAMSRSTGQQPAPSKFKRDLSGGDIPRAPSQGVEGGKDSIIRPLEIQEEEDEDDDDDDDDEEEFSKLKPIQPFRRVVEPVDMKKGPAVTVEEVYCDEERDLEKGSHHPPNLARTSRSSGFSIPPAVSQLSRQMISVSLSPQRSPTGPSTAP